MTRFWIGVASRDHVKLGAEGGFCQLCHGKASPLRRLAPGDRIVYYSPRETMRGGDSVQAFTAIGQVLADDPRPTTREDGRVFYRRDIDFYDASEAPIRPMLERLSFTRGRRSWGYAFRWGAFQITPEDYALISRAMGVDDLVVSDEAA